MGVKVSKVQEDGALLRPTDENLLELLFAMLVSDQPWTFSPETHPLLERLSVRTTKMIAYKPYNHQAHVLLNQAIETIDKRLSLPTDEVQLVVATLLAQSHKVIHLPAHKRITDALLGEVLGRDSGKARFFVKPAYRDPEAEWATKDEDQNFPFPPRTKGGAWVKTAEAAKTILWDEVSSVGFAPAYYIGPVDFAATVGAFRAGSEPCVNFTSCQHAKDEEGAVAFALAASEAAKMQGIPLVQISDGWVCADPNRALMLFHTETTRFFNKAGLRFSFITRDKWGRQEQAWGAYK